MSPSLERVLKYFAQQGRQASTWRGVILVVTSLTGAHLPPDKAVAIMLVGMAFAGLVGAIVPDAAPKKPEETPPPTDNTKGNP